jgi:hypothetical protein
MYKWLRNIFRDIGMWCINMADETQKRSKHDARMEFSKLLTDIMRNTMNAQQVSLQTWWEWLFNYYTVTNAFIDEKTRKEFEERLLVLDNKISLSTTQGKLGDIKYNQARRELIFFQKDIYYTTSGLLTPIDQDDDDDDIIVVPQ